MVDYPPCRKASWSEVDRWVGKLADSIERADRRPDVIVALTRGGWVPARLLADRLVIRRVLTIRTQHWGVTATPSGQAELTEGLTAQLTGEKALVVDDITDTGESLELATHHVTEHGATQVESATCLHILHSKVVPTYYAETIGRDAWVWVIFPWTYWEDLRTLAGRAFDEVQDEVKATKVLKERCELDVPLAHVKRALARRSDGTTE
jgi:hypoxanthine phosphoribosyltransferase